MNPVLRCLVLGAFALAASLPTQADKWMPPAREEVLSADGQWRFTMTPRETFGSPAPSRGADGRDATSPRARSRDRRQSATGLLQHRERAEWHEIWQGPLANHDAPVRMLLSNRGQLATVDDWGHTGYGETVVVLYDLEGHVIRHLGLEDFLPHSYVTALEHSMSSIDWGCWRDHRFTSDAEFVIAVRDLSKPDAEPMGRPCLGFVLNASTGAVRPPEAGAWQRARAAAITLNRASHDADVRASQAFREPLMGPVGSADAGRWWQYLEEAYSRLDPDWRKNNATIKVLGHPNDPNYALQLGYLRDALVRERTDVDPLVVGAVDSTQLLVELRSMIGVLPPGSLKRARIYLALGQADFAAARVMFARSGARLIMVNPERAIPQRRARLAHDERAIPPVADPRDYE